MSFSFDAKLIFCIVMLFTLKLSFAQTNAQYKAPENIPEARQFDFWMGEWEVQNRFKQDDNSWQDEGTAEVKIFSVLDGKAVMEFWSGTARDMKETRGFSLRYFDAKSKKWKLALNWPQPNNGGFFFLKGEFRHNRGEFFVDYKNQNGKQIIQRYTFSDITPNSLRWNDGTSLDGGKTWETNWIMEFSRTGDEPEWPSIDELFHTQDNDSWNTTKEGKRFDRLVGSWKGKSEISKPEGDITRNVEMNVWKVLNGSSYLMELHTLNEDPFKEILMLTYREMNNGWLLLGLDNRKESEFNLFMWKITDTLPVFKKLSRDKNEDAAITWNEISANKIDITKVDNTNNITVNMILKKY